MPAVNPAYAPLRCKHGLCLRCIGSLLQDKEIHEGLFCACLPGESKLIGLPAARITRSLENRLARMRSEPRVSELKPNENICQISMEGLITAVTPWTCQPCPSPQKTPSSASRCLSKLLTSCHGRTLASPDAAHGVKGHRDTRSTSVPIAPPLPHRPQTPRQLLGFRALLKRSSSSQLDMNFLPVRHLQGSRPQTGSSHTQISPMACSTYGTCS